MLQYKCSKEQEEAIYQHIKGLWQELTEEEKANFSFAEFPTVIRRPTSSAYCRENLVVEHEGLSITLDYGYGTTREIVENSFRYVPCVYYWPFWAIKSKTA